MPSANELVADLQAIANEWRTVATAWHVFLAILVTSLYLGWRPSVRLFLPLLVLPLLGVSAVAGLTGNPFNSAIFAMLALTLGALAFTQRGDPVRFGAWRTVSIGAALVVFGAAYPHFVEVNSWLTYAYAAPLGLIPCPTLAVVIGMSLMLNGCDSPSWSGVLAVAGIFYAAIGVVWFGIAIDAVLFAGALALAIHAVAPGHSRPRSRGASAAIASIR
jgi:hypothetical protein